jgi:hypothetical protein
MFHSKASGTRRDFKVLGFDWIATLCLSFVSVTSEEGGAEETTINGRLVDNEGVLLVVSGVASDAHDAIDATRELTERDRERRREG